MAPIKKRLDELREQPVYCPYRQKTVARCPDWENRHLCYDLPPYALCDSLKEELKIGLGFFEVLTSKPFLKCITTELLTGVKFKLQPGNMKGYANVNEFKTPIGELFND